MRKLFVVFMTIWTYLAAMPMAMAQSWPGREDPALIAALDLWLGGTDDMAVLRALVPLAQGGNAAAQVFLATIVANTALRPAEVDTMVRADRIALTRAPGGLSGTSWRRVAAEVVPLAVALGVAHEDFANTPADGQRAALEALLAAGEARSALGLLGTFANHGGFGPTGGWSMVAEFGGHPALGTAALTLLEMTRNQVTDPALGAQNPVVAIQAMGAINASGATPDDLTLVRASLRQHSTRSDPAALAAARTAAAVAQVASPLPDLCAFTCPKEVGACTLALFMATGGLPGFVTLSPLEGVVATSDYRASARFRRDVQVALQGRPRVYLEDMDACAAAVIWD